MSCRVFPSCGHPRVRVCLGKERGEGTNGLFHDGNVDLEGVRRGQEVSEQSPEFR